MWSSGNPSLHFPFLSSTYEGKKAATFCIIILPIQRAERHENKIFYYVYSENLLWELDSSSIWDIYKLLLKS